VDAPPPPSVPSIDSPLSTATTQLCRTPEQGPEAMSPHSRQPREPAFPLTRTPRAAHPDFSSIALALPSHAAAAALFVSLVLHTRHTQDQLSLLAGMAQCDPLYLLSLSQVGTP
jgi:hypothetical protein